jgi:CRISPR type I-E-associated protein CasB/Cse2
MNISKMVTDLTARAAADKGAVVALKAAATPSMAYRAYPLLVPFIDISNDRQMSVARVLSPAIVKNGHTIDAGNLGKTLSQLRARRKNWAELTMQRILGSAFESRCQQVTHVLRMAATDDIPVDLDLLGRDLYYWNDRTGRQWAMAFWSVTNDSDI